VLFVLVLGGVGYCAWAAVHWYVNNSFFVGLSHGQVVIYKGRIGGFLGIDPTVVVKTGITLAEIRASDVGRTQEAPSLQAGVEEPSRQKAIDYVCNMAALAYNFIAPRGVQCPAKTAPATSVKAAPFRRAPAPLRSATFLRSAGESPGTSRARVSRAA